MVSVGRPAALASLTPPRLKDAKPNDELPLTIILHGLLGSSNNWRSIMARNDLLPGRFVCALDLRNHGRSQHANSMTFKVTTRANEGRLRRTGSTSPGGETPAFVLRFKLFVT